MGLHVLLPKATPGDPVAGPPGQAAAAEAFFASWSRPWAGRVALSRPAYPSVDRSTAEAELASELELQVDLLNERLRRQGSDATNTVRTYA
ncbi:MAG: hypothetical protein ACREQM_10910, partial [Candidatus Dormibacteraceae bacterium]